MKRPLFAYVSSVDPRDKRPWSGTHHSIFNAIKKSIGEVEILGPYEPRLASKMGKIKTGITQKLSGKRFDYRHSRAMARAFAAYFSPLLQKKEYDYILAPAASCETALLHTHIPIIYISDTTFQRSLGYHKALTGLTENSAREGNEIERLALEKSRLIVVSSQWARDSVIGDYRIPGEKVLVLPFGPNLQGLPPAENIKTELSEGEIKILFPAVYWENKGGAIAFNCLTELLAAGIKAQLIVVGCLPPANYSHEKMQVIPFLDKNKKEDLEKLHQIFSEADFLILPTRFDCTPVVFCEASAFGLPSLCADTGGVRGHIHEGQNGFLVDYYDTGKGYAEKIRELISDRRKYSELRKSARRLFEDLLNWDHWAAELKRRLT